MLITESISKDEKHLENSILEKEIEKFLNEFDLNADFLIDIFPNKVDDYLKYNQIEIFFQKFLNRDISKKAFIDEEEKFIRFFIYLWSLNNTFAFVNNITPLNKNYVAKKCKKEIKKYKNSEEKNHSLFKVKNVDILKSLIHIGAREISQVYLFFIEWNIIIELSGLVALIQFENQKNIIEIGNIANVCNLFARDRER